MKTSDKPTPYVFKANDHWFYSFDYRWVCYRSNQGYETKEQALAAASDQIVKVLTSDWN